MKKKNIAITIIMMCVLCVLTSTPVHAKASTKTVTVKNNKYQITGSKTAKLKSVKNTTTKVTVPDTIKIKDKTYRITAIADNALKNKKVKSITIGENVTKIGKNAFANCKKLKTVTIKAKGLKTVGKDAFKSIAKNATVKVPCKSNMDKLLQSKGLSDTAKVVNTEHNYKHYPATGHETKVMVRCGDWEDIEEWHVFCGGCHKDFGVGADAEERYAVHAWEEFDRVWYQDGKRLDTPNGSSDCGNYYTSTVVVGRKWRPAEYITTWEEDTPAYDKCTDCGHKK